MKMPFAARQWNAVCLPMAVAAGVFSGCKMERSATTQSGQQKTVAACRLKAAFFPAILSNESAWVYDMTCLVMRITCLVCFLFQGVQRSGLQTACLQVANHSGQFIWRSCVIKRARWAESFALPTHGTVRMKQAWLLTALIVWDTRPEPSVLSFDGHHVS